MTEHQPQTLPVYPVQYISATQDEISLVDIWLIMRKHHKLFLLVAVGITLLGLVYALFMDKSYGLNTSLEIGSEIRNGIIHPIESPETTKAKLENALLPMVTNKLNSENEEAENYGVHVSIPKNSSLILLTSNIKKGEESTYRDLHNKIVDTISQEHSKFINVRKSNLNTQLALANIRLDELQDPTTLEALIKPQEKILADASADLSALSDPEIFGAKVKTMEGEIQTRKDKLALLEDQTVILDHKLKSINTNQELIKQQIKELEVEISNATALKEISAQNLRDESVALAQLMLGNELQENRKLLAQLKVRLHITLENEKTSTIMALEEKKRTQELQEDSIAEAEANLKAFTGKNLLDQNKLKASVIKAKAKIAQLISDQKRNIATQQQEVVKVQIKLDNLLETHAVAEPSLSFEPTSTSRRIILLIAMFLGVVMGIFAVFFAELREKVAETATDQ